MKNRIRELREEKGMTQEQLGEMVGTSRQAINAIETEKFEPSIWLAYDISKVFGCPIEDVFCLKKVQENQGLIVAGGIIMAIRNIRYYDDPILRKRCKEVKVINDKIRQILDDMLDTLQQTENGAAIAANQVGILKRLVVIDYDECCLKLVNPLIIGYSGIQECNEACLSFPNRCVKIIRPQKVTIQAQNEYGEEIMITAEDGLAQCFCHELEHLDGEIFLDKAIEEIDIQEL